MYHLRLETERHSVLPLKLKTNGAIKCAVLRAVPLRFLMQTARHIFGHNGTEQRTGDRTERENGTGVVRTICNQGLSVMLF